MEAHQRKVADATAGLPQDEHIPTTVSPDLTGQHGAAASAYSSDQMLVEALVNTEETSRRAIDELKKEIRKIDDEDHKSKLEARVEVLEKALEARAKLVAVHNQKRQEQTDSLMERAEALEEGYKKKTEAIQAMEEKIKKREEAIEVMKANFEGTLARLETLKGKLEDMEIEIENHRAEAMVLEEVVAGVVAQIQAFCRWLTGSRGTGSR